MNRALTALAIACTIDVSASQRQQQGGRIHHLEELRWPQVDALDRNRTMFLLTVGMLEQHGPHLPIGADTFGVSHETNAVSERVAGSLPEWNVVLMPLINYGQGGANQIGGQLVHPGTYGIRQSTIRSLVADLGAHIALNRFKWIFVLNGHGAPPHHVAINEACDFVSERYGVSMLHVSGLFGADERIQSEGRKIAAQFFSAQEVMSFGLDVHAGVSETSAMLALRPDLVDGGYKTLPALAGHSREELQTIAKRPGWSGYLSSPARASAAYGRAVEQWWVQGLSDLILRAARGEDLSKAPRAPDRIDATLASILGPALEDEQAFEAAFQDWRSRHPPR